jgi:hypothetical protein
MKYITSEKNPSDFFSRHPAAKSTDNSVNAIEQYVSYVIDKVVPKTMSIEEIKYETANDEILKVI